MTFTLKNKILSLFFRYLENYFLFNKKGGYMEQSQIPQWVNVVILFIILGAAFWASKKRVERQNKKEDKKD